MERVNQNRRVLDFLRLHGSITPMQALKKFGCYRLGARIHELRSQGHCITSTLIKTSNDKHVCRYTLEK